MKSDWIQRIPSKPATTVERPKVNNKQQHVLICIKCAGAGRTICPALKVKVKVKVNIFIDQQWARALFFPHFSHLFAHTIKKNNNDNNERKKALDRGLFAGFRIVDGREKRGSGRGEFNPLLPCQVTWWVRRRSLVLLSLWGTRPWMRM